VVAPLLVESSVIGVLIAARRAPRSFSSGECEFLKTIERACRPRRTPGETLRARWQGAYNDLRQTQQAILQQERLRALGQMASGIAHGYQQCDFARSNIR